MNKNKAEGNFYPSALTVAGSDSGGGAGIQADLRTFNAYGVFGCSAITAATSQNPTEVTRIDAIPAAGVRAQIDAVSAKIALAAVKTGMLFSADTVRCVARAVREHRFFAVCDPVMVSTSGSRLLEEEAVEAFREELLPEAKWVTPNLPEAELLLGCEIRSDEEMLAAAKAFFDRWGVDVLLKSGHDHSRSDACDFVCRGGKLYRLRSPKLELPPFAAHGTGCTLSAAIAAGFALGFPWKQALCEAKAFVLGSLRENIEIGSGIHAMYPPVEDSRGVVKLESVEA